MNKQWRIPGKLCAAMACITLLTAVLLACGPVAQTDQRESSALQAAPQQQDQETPESCPHTEGAYPNLIAAFQEIVNKYETCELTEEEAAALDSRHHGNMVLAQVWTDVGQTSAIDQWMGKQSISPKATIDGVPLIYAYVRVSLLGPLSQQDGISEILNISIPHAMPDENAGVTARSDNQEPVLPTWLKGYKDSKLRMSLDTLYRLHLNGTLPDDFCGKSRLGRGYVALTVYMQPDQESVETVKTWLTDNGITLREDLYIGETLDYGPRAFWMSLSVRFDKLIALSELPEVQFLRGKECVPLSSTMPAPAGVPIVSPAELHNADDWITGTGKTYDGSWIKIGIHRWRFRRYPHQDERASPAFKPHKPHGGQPSKSIFSMLQP